MPLQKAIFKPGINREGTDYDNEGGWFDCNLVRFRKGRPEKKDGKDYYRWDFRSNSDNKRKNKMLRYGSGQVDIFCLVALPLDKVFFLSFDEVQNSIAKSIDNLKKIDSKESLLKCLLEVNKIPNLEPIDATTESNI